MAAPDTEAKGDAGSAGGNALDVVRVHYRWTRGIRGRLDAGHGTSLVEEVDGAVGQPIVAQVPRGQLRSRFERRVGVCHTVVCFVSGLQTGENLHRFVD